MISYDFVLPQYQGLDTRWRVASRLTRVNSDECLPQLFPLRRLEESNKQNNPVVIITDFLQKPTGENKQTYIYSANGSLRRATHHPGSRVGNRHGSESPELRLLKPKPPRLRAEAWQRSSRLRLVQRDLPEAGRVLIWLEVTNCWWVQRTLPGGLRAAYLSHKPWKRQTMEFSDPRQK